MATPDYWAEPLYDRHRTRVFSLDESIAEDDPVRMVDEVLTALDWSSWEACYQRKRGQPPIHPRYLAAAILYGLYRGIRSSRRLEEACRYRIDFMWLVNGNHIDHTTFSRFRTKFREELKQLFRQIGRTAIELGLASLGRVGFDGTRVKANNSRFRTLTAKTLEEKLRALDKLFDELCSQMNTTDDDQAGEGSPTQLPPELADLQDRRERIKETLEKAKAADEARRRQGVNRAKNPAQVPVTDPDSRVMPNKDGGYAPNYTPVATTEGQNGFILDADVLAEVNESPAAVAAVDRIEETFGTNPGDAGDGTAGCGILCSGGIRRSGTRPSGVSGGPRRTRPRISARGASPQWPWLAGQIVLRVRRGAGFVLLPDGPGVAVRQEQAGSARK